MGVRLPRTAAFCCSRCPKKANKLAVIDLASLKVVRTVDVPEHPVKVLARPRTAKLLMFPGSGSKQVAVVDLSQWKVDSLIDAGKGVDGLAWAAAGSHSGVHNQHQKTPGSQSKRSWLLLSAKGENAP